VKALFDILFFVFCKANEISGAKHQSLLPRAIVTEIEPTTDDIVLSAGNAINWRHQQGIRFVQML